MKTTPLPENIIIKSKHKVKIFYLKKPDYSAIMEPKPK